MAVLKNLMLDIENVVYIYIAVRHSKDTKATGWGAFILRGENPMKKFYGGIPDADINCGYLTAVTEVMDALDPSEIILYAEDSVYLCVNMEEGRVKNWRKRGWRTSNNTPVKNKELWEKLLEEEEAHNVIEWIPNTGTDKHKDEAVALAQKGRKKVSTQKSSFMTEEPFDDSDPDDY